jgi:hypothetical protein
MKTTSQEISKRLVEAGIEVDTYFSYSRRIDLEGYDFYLAWTDDVTPDDRWEIIPAPTADELGELLPYGIGTFELKFGKDMYVPYYAEYSDVINGSTEYLNRFDADTMADAMALMLLWLKENGHLDSKKEGR